MRASARPTKRSFKPASQPRLSSESIAYITWSVGDDIPLGTDTFVVEDGKIVSQTFAMYAAPSS
jgi:hypothetical protein